MTANNLHLWDKSMWPPQSPDLNPLDYAIWGIMEQKVCAVPHPGVDALRVCILREWDILTEQLIRNSWKAFRSQIEAMLVVDGSHFE